jgi:DNA-binding NarL/FixJ family response regulator
MDIQMPVMNGVEATRIIKESNPDVSVIILTTFDDDDYIIDALSNGADGYLLKDIDALHLVRAIQDAYNGVLMVPARIASKLAARISGGSGNIVRNKNDALKNYFELTERERQIALLMVENLGNRQIAKKLFLTEGTVKNYISEIYSKLGINDREQAVLLLAQKLNDIS